MPLARFAWYQVLPGPVFASYRLRIPSRSPRGTAAGLWDGSSCSACWCCLFARHCHEDDAPVPPHPLLLDQVQPRCDQDHDIEPKAMELMVVDEMMMIDTDDG